MLISLFFLLSVITIHGQYIWDDQNVGNGIKPDIAYHNGTIFIAFMSEQNDGFVKCSQITNGVLNTSTVSNGYFYGPLDIAVDNSGFARIVYHDHDDEDLIHAFQNGNNWTLERIVSSGHDGWDGSIYIDESNMSHLVSVDPSEGIEYATSDGSVWMVENVNPSNTNYKFATSIKKSDDVVHVAYHITSDAKMFYSKRENEMWSTELVAENGIYPSMIIDENGAVSIAYYLINNDESSIQIASNKNGRWQSSKVEDIGDVEVNFSGARKIVDLEYEDGKYHIAFSNKFVVRYGTLEADGWKLENAVDVSNLEKALGQQISLVIDDNNLPHMTYYERSNQVVEDGIIRYVHTSGIDTSNNSQQSLIHLSSKSTSGEELSNVVYQIMDDDKNVLISISTDSILLDELDEGASMICPKNSANPTQNVSALDLVRTQRLVLGVSENCKTDFIAADVNKSGEVSALDIIQIINVILGKNENFQNDDSWRFFKKQNDLESLSLHEIYNFECVSLSNLENNEEIEFVAVKLGDIKCER